MTDKIKPCPCGKVPTNIKVRDVCGRYLWTVSGDCCDKWSVESILGHHDDIREAALEAWNNAPRGGG